MTEDTFITDLRTIFGGLSTTDLPTANAEVLIDAVIDELNLRGCSLDNMAGSAGSKTITLTGAQRAGVRKIFRCIYASWNKNLIPVTTTGLGAISVSSSDLMSNPTVLAMIKEVAAQLQTSTTVPLYIGTDTLPY